MAMGALNSAVLRLETLLPAKRRRPQTLSIEPTRRCSLNGPLRLVGLQNSLPNTGHDLLPRGLGNVEWSLYEKILIDAVDFGISKVQLHFQGRSP